jgi:hypothetical protein
VGTAVNVTEVPAQTLFAEAEIETLTGSKGLMIMVTVLDVAGLPLVHVALEVRTHFTASPFAGV